MNDHVTFLLKMVSTGVLVGLMSLLLMACEKGGMEKTETFISIKDIPQEQWDRLARKKIYFGHQSVGYNIVDGLVDLLREYPDIRLNIVETHDAADFNVALFAHSKIGRNVEPESKIDQFAEFVESGIGEVADLAFFKFCYIDVASEDDVGTLFTVYKNRLESLRIKYPQTAFIHVTMPLTVVQTGPKKWIKTLIGRPVGGYAENIKRNQFNDLLREEYLGREPVFDLALIESTTGSGMRSIFESHGGFYYSLNPEFTHDGGHLNARGRRIVAEQLLIFLANT